MTFRNPLQTINTSQIKLVTANTPPRWVIGGDTVGAETIAGYTASPNETAPAQLAVATEGLGDGSTYSIVSLTSAQENGLGTSSIKLYSESSTGAGASTVDLTGDFVQLFGTDQVVFTCPGGVYCSPNTVLLPKTDLTTFAGSAMYAADFSDWGAGRAVGGYTVDASGWVHLQGFVKVGAASAPAGTVILTGLPAPKDGAIHSFTIATSASAAVIDVNGSGGVGLFAGTTVPPGGWIQLDDITYRAL